jgi:hypothetical protein
VTPAERRIFASIVGYAVAPAPPLPPVEATDTVVAFEDYLSRCPAPNRVGLRAALHLLELAPLATHRKRLTRLDPAARDAFLTRLEAGALGPLLMALAGLAHFSFYGDEQVLRDLGYDAAAVVARGRELRAAEGRW